MFISHAIPTHNCYQETYNAAKGETNHVHVYKCTGAGRSTQNRSIQSYDSNNMTLRSRSSTQPQRYVGNVKKELRMYLRANYTTPKFELVQETTDE
jgi:hypothetical protein